MDNRGCHIDANELNVALDALNITIANLKRNETDLVQP
jgi:hypothetical protein